MVPVIPTPRFGVLTPRICLYLALIVRENPPWAVSLAADRLSDYLPASVGTGCEELIWIQEGS